jgi:hypothetical protein
MTVDSFFASNYLIFTVWQNGSLLNGGWQNTSLDNLVENMYGISFTDPLL